MSGRVPYVGTPVLHTNPGEPVTVRFSLRGFSLTGINWVYLYLPRATMEEQARLNRTIQNEQHQDAQQNESGTP